MALNSAEGALGRLRLAAMRGRGVGMAAGGGAAAAAVGGALLATRLMVQGKLTLDLGVGRRTRALGPLRRTIAAPAETVFDVIAAPYLERTPRAMNDKLRVLEKGSDMALAAHITSLPGGRMATTVETVCFDRPHLISFRLVRGPVPEVTETFELGERDGTSTDFVYTGELVTDLWAAGRWWGERVAVQWERAVQASLESIATEAERRARAHRRG